MTCAFIFLFHLCNQRRSIVVVRRYLFSLWSFNGNNYIKYHYNNNTLVILVFPSPLLCSYFRHVSVSHQTFQILYFIENVFDKMFFFVSFFVHHTTRTHIVHNTRWQRANYARNLRLAPAACHRMLFYKPLNLNCFSNYFHL